MLNLPDTIAAMARTDPWAQAELLRMHEGMIISLAKRSFPSAESFEFEDVKQEVSITMLGLATGSWQPNAGCSFSTYCFNWIPSIIRRKLDRCAYLLKIPAHKGIKDRRDGVSGIPMATSLFKPSKFEDSEDQFLDEVEDFNRPTITDEDRIDLANMIGKLTERQQRVVHKVLAGYSLSEIAEEDSLTPQAVSAMYRSSVAKLRGMAKAAK